MLCSIVMYLLVNRFVLRILQRFRDDLTGLRETLTDLTSLGQVLLQASNGARAKEIEGAIKRLDELWLRVNEKAINRLDSVQFIVADTDDPDQCDYCDGIFVDLTGYS